MSVEEETEIVLADQADDEFVRGAGILLSRGRDAKKVPDDALVGGMNIVGEHCRDGILCVPEALGSERPDVPGMSALLTTTMPHMKDQGIRDDRIVLVGGAPLNEAFGAAIGADADCRDAATTVGVATDLVLERQAS